MEKPAEDGNLFFIRDKFKQNVRQYLQNPSFAILFSQGLKHGLISQELITTLEKIDWIGLLIRVVPTIDPLNPDLLDFRTELLSLVKWAKENTVGELPPSFIVNSITEAFIEHTVSQLLIATVASGVSYQIVFNWFLATVKRELEV